MESVDGDYEEGGAPHGELEACVLQRAEIDEHCLDHHRRASEDLNVYVQYKSDDLQNGLFIPGILRRDRNGLDYADEKAYQATRSSADDRYRYGLPGSV